PFSPSSAWISPRRSSKSIASFATSDPNRFVMWRSSSAGASALKRLLHRVGDVGQRAGRDLGLHGLDLGQVLRALGVGLADADAVGLDVEDAVRAAAYRAALRLPDRVEDGDVDVLLGRGHDLGAEVGLVGVHADRLHALLLRRV